MTNQRAHIAIQRDIATDPAASTRERAEARRALRCQRDAKNAAIDRALQRARRQGPTSANRWALYNEIKRTLPEMAPQEFEGVIMRLSEILDV